MTPISVNRTVNNSFGNIFRSVLGVAASGNGGARTDLLPADMFGRIVERERARADRIGGGFSLVAFGGKKADLYRGESRAVGEHLVERIRTTDEIGWLDDGRLGVMLPDTPTAGAWKFVEDVRVALSDAIRIPPCTVYSYPESWTNGYGAGGDNRRTAARSGSRPSDIRVVTSRHCAIPAGAADEGLPGGSAIPRWKRALDVTGALIGLVLFSPLFLAIALLIKLVSPGPVFYKQERVGFRGRPFTFWKFRTMHLHNDATNHKAYLGDLIRGGDKPMEKLDNGRDPRIIPFGNVLRAACLDELPQLLNVLSGDMSLVGPRPCLPYEAQEYQQWHARRFDALPGMTGLWQVNGKNRTTFKQMIRYDIAYSRQASPWLDFKILLKTVPTIVGMVAGKVTHARETPGEAVALSAAKRA